MDTQKIIALLRETFADWNEDKAPRLAAALAYYTVFSIAPLVLIAVAITGLLNRDAGNQLAEGVAAIIPGGGGDAIEQLIEGASQRRNEGIIATAIGFATLLFGAAGFFGQLQDALNTIWEVEPKPGQGIMAMLKQRFFSFTMVLGTVFLLLVSLVISTALAGMIRYFETLLPGADFIWQLLSTVVSVGVTSLIFALIFKIVPDAEIAWSDVWIGALATAILFTIGQLLLGWYLSRPDTVSTYGSFGSLIVLLLWVYYSAQILFLGAEFTQIYARTYGSQIQPAPNARAVTEEARSQQGLTRKGDDPGPEGGAERQVGGPPRERAPQGSVTAPPQQPTRGGALGVVAGFLAGLALNRRGRKP